MEPEIVKVFFYKLIRDDQRRLHKTDIKKYGENDSKKAIREVATFIQLYLSCIRPRKLVKLNYQRKGMTGIHQNFFYFFQTIAHLCLSLTLNALPNDNFLDWSKLKALADDEINVT